MTMVRNILVVVFYLLCSAIAYADDESTYSPARVVYDLTSPDPQVINHTLDRINLLQNLYNHDVFNASIVIVIHDGAIPHFSRKKNTSSELLQRASSLVLSDMIEFRLCRASARLQGYESDDFPGFVKVIPMADAEMVQLQNAGYAYLN